jgi:hypothetical protein
MDMFAYCRAMAPFCRQRARFEGENNAFWTREVKNGINCYPSARPHNLKFEPDKPEGRNVLASGRDDLLSLIFVNPFFVLLSVVLRPTHIIFEVIFWIAFVAAALKIAKIYYRRRDVLY